MMTKCTVYRVGQKAPEEVEIDFHARPPYHEIKRLLGPIIGGDPEHVSVLHDGRVADMFVDEEGAAKGLPRNKAASAIYRASALANKRETFPDDLPAIFGTAVLVSRRIWF